MAKLELKDTFAKFLIAYFAIKSFIIYR